LPPGFFQQEKIYVTTAELFALWRAIGETSGDPGIGLKLGAEPRFERYQPTAIAAVCSRSFRDALQRMARYKQLTCPEEIRIHTTREEAAVEFFYLRAEEAQPDVLLKAIGVQLETELKERKTSADVGEQVKHTLKRSLAGKRPTLQHVAREMRTSVRTLQRRLTDAGITFQQIVEDTRRDLAHHYLKQSTVELNEAAYLLGYEDANSFFRAFHLWEGITPGDWRTRHRTTEVGVLGN
jgi:AraC-like DNA-binding protein